MLERLCYVRDGLQYGLHYAAGEYPGNGWGDKLPCLSHRRKANAKSISTRRRRAKEKTNFNKSLKEFDTA